MKRKRKKDSKNRLEIARKIISDVKREMQKPRLTESVRRDERYQAKNLLLVLQECELGPPAGATGKALQ
jgi:hypothetical protein